jgi:hypothetical protein
MANIRIKGITASYWKPIEGGSNVKMDIVDTGNQTLVLSMQEGTYVPQPPPDTPPSPDDPPGPVSHIKRAPVLTINGVPPLDDGMFMLRGDECNSVDYMATGTVSTLNENAVVVYNNCTPCENCSDVMLMKARYEYYLIWMYLLLNANTMDDAELLQGFRTLLEARLQLDDACVGTNTLQLPDESIGFKLPETPEEEEGFSLPDGLQGIQLLRQYQTLVQMWNSFAIRQADDVVTEQSGVSPYGFVPRIRISMPFCETGDEIAQPFEPGAGALPGDTFFPVRATVKVWTDDERFDGCIFITEPQINATPTILLNGKHVNLYVSENKCTTATVELYVAHIPGMVVGEIAFHVLPFYEVEYWHKRTEPGGIQYEEKFDITDADATLPPPKALLMPYGRIREYIPIDVKPRSVPRDEKTITEQIFKSSQYIKARGTDPVHENDPAYLVWNIDVTVYRVNSEGMSTAWTDTYSYTAPWPKRPDLEAFGGNDPIEDTDYTHDRYVLPDAFEPYPYPSQPEP